MNTKRKYSDIVKNIEMSIMIKDLLLNVLPIVLIAWMESETFILTDTTLALVTHVEITAIDIIWTICILVILFIALTKVAVFFFASTALVILFLLDYTDACEQCSGTFRSVSVTLKLDPQSQSYRLYCPHCGYYLAHTRSIQDILQNPLSK